MLRRFRKRRDGQHGAENNYGLYNDSNECGHDDDDEGGQAIIQQPQHHQLQNQQPQHQQLQQQQQQQQQLSQPMFKHILLAGEGEQDHEKIAIVEDRDRYSNQNKPSAGHVVVVVGRSSQVQTFSKQQARVVTPNKKEPPTTPPRITTIPTINNVSPLQERSRQKLDVLSRQHQRYQRQNKYHHHQQQHANNTPPTSCSVTTDGTTDSSMQPLPDCGGTQQLLQRNRNNNNYNSILPPSSLTRRIVTCNDLWEGNSAAGASSLESSYYSKHDFHNLPRGFSFAEDSNVSWALETSFENLGGNNNNNKNENSGDHNGMPGTARPINVRHHEYDYQPSPPQKRSGSDANETLAMRRVHQEELARRRSCPSQLQREQQTTHAQHEQRSREIEESSTLIPAIELKLSEVLSCDENDNDGGGNHITVIPDPRGAKASDIDCRDPPGPIMKSGPFSPSASSLSLAVTPSPPFKPHKPVLTQNRTLNETGMHPGSDPPEKQVQRDDTAPLNAIDAAGSVASTAKISNTPHLISRLLMRHPKSKLRSINQQQNNIDQSEPKQKVDRSEELTNEQPQQPQQQQQQQQKKKKSEATRDPKTETPKGILKSHPIVSRKLAEPPEELQSSTQQTQRRRPDPPAECKHYHSKDSKSQHLRWAGGEQHSQPTKIQNSTQSEFSTHPSHPFKSEQYHNFHSTPALRKPQAELQPPSQLNLQKTLRNNQQRVQTDLTTPVPFKKVTSTPSNFSSFFTDQTVNTVSTSKFWDDIEGFSDQKKGTRTTHGTENIASDEMILIGTDEYFNSHLVRVKKDPVVAKGAENMQQTNDTSQPKTAVSNLATTKSSKLDAETGLSSNRVQSPLESIHEDESNAFSLKLPMHGNAGGFDDSDISALQMNDSATVYYQRQLHCAGGDVLDPDNYWKKKYDKLKEETIAVLGSGMMVAEDDEEPHQLQSNNVHDDAQEDEELVELAEIADLHNSKDTQRKERDETHQSEAADTTNRTDSTHLKEPQRFASPFNSLNEFCDAVINGTDCNHREKHYQEVTVHTMKKTAETMLNFVTQIEKGNKGSMITQDLRKMKGLGNEIQACASTCMPEVYGTYQDFTIVDDVLPPMQPRESDEQARLVEAPLEKAEPSVINDAPPTLQHGASRKLETSFETDDESDGRDLMPLGFVPLEQNESAVDDNLDVSILQQWNKSRAEKCAKSLADDLTAGASRLSLGLVSKESSFEEDGDQSELSENAKLIFEAAIKKDIPTLHAERSFICPTAGNTSTANNPSEFHPDSSHDISKKPGVVGSSGTSLEHYEFIIPRDFSNWFELPSPGSMCIPLLPLFSASLQLSSNIFDASDATPLDRVDDVVRLALADFLSRVSHRWTRDEIDVNIVKQSIGSIIVENGSVRFVNSAVSLPEISQAAVFAISRRQFQDATEVYHCLLRKFQDAAGAKLALVGQVIASTLQNLSVLHLWQQEYDKALPCCREAIKMKKEVEGDEGGSIDLWANLGLINYAIGSAPSSLAAFRMAAQISSKFFPDEYLMGRLMNNMAAVNFEIGTNLQLVQSQFQQAVHIQKNGSTASSDEADVSVENLLSESISTFNVGVTCAKQNQVEDAISHMTSCYAIQQAILDSNNKIVLSTAYYMGSLRRSVPGLAGEEAMSSLGENQPQPALYENRTAHTSWSVSDHKELSEPTQRVHEEEPTKGVRPEVVASAEGRNPTSAQGGEVTNSYPILCLGSLRVEATISQRVHHSLEGCFDSLSRSREPNLLLCRRTNISSKYKTMSQNLIQKGVQAIKKREAVSTLHKNLDRYGPRHPEVGKSHHNVGLICLLTEHYQEAVTHIEHAVRIYTNTMGLKHPEVASTLMLKGLAQLALERFDDAMASMYRVQHSREHILGRQHPELGLILNNMACVQYELHDYKNAEELFQEALDLQREIFSTDPAFLKQVSIVLCNIAFLHAKSGSFPKALIELEGALQIRQDILSEDDEAVSDILQNMAHILAIHQLQHGAVNLDEMTEEYITMLKKSGTKQK